MSASAPILVTAALLTLLPAAGLADDERAVESRRVVVRVDVDTERQSYDYVFVDHQDGEPVVLGSRLAERGYLGVDLLELTPELREHFGAPRDTGVMISSVEPDSPALVAGLRPGDILIAIDGAPIESSTAIVHRVFSGHAGQRLALEVHRDGRRISLEATLEALRRPQLDLGGLLRTPGADSGLPRLDLERHGLPMVELDPESMHRALSLMRRHFESPEWRERLEGLSGERQGLEMRIQELEQRLRELERQLDDLPE